MTLPDDFIQLLEDDQQWPSVRKKFMVHEGEVVSLIHPHAHKIKKRRKNLLKISKKIKRHKIQRSDRKLDRTLKVS